MIRAYISDATTAGGMVIDVTIVDRHESMSPLILHFVDGLHTWDSVDSLGVEIQPTFRLAHEEAVALMAALNTRYSGVDDERMLRKDYDAERGRVDTLTAALSGIATTLAGAK